MPFNAETYRANRYQKSAWAYLAKARDVKSRAARGEAYDWEIPRIPFFVRMARIDMHLHLKAKAIRDLSRKGN